MSASRAAQVPDDNIPLVSLKQKLLLNSRKRSVNTSRSSREAKYMKGKNNVTSSSGNITSSSGARRTKNTSNTNNYSHDNATNHQVNNSSSSTTSTQSQATVSPIEPSVEIDLPFIDTTAIISLILNPPQIFYTSDRMPGITCNRKFNGQTVTKIFENLTMLQMFLKSNDARMWLMDSVESESSIEVFDDANRVIVSERPSVKVDVDDTYASYSDTEMGIQNISFIEKSNSYKVDYICPCDGFKVTKIFGKFSLLQEFLRSGDVRGCLIDMIEKNRKYCSVASGTAYHSQREYESATTKDIKTEVDSFSIAEETPIVKEEVYDPDYQTFTNSAEVDASVIEMSENVDDQLLNAEQIIICSEENFDNPELGATDDFSGGEVHFPEYAEQKVVAFRKERGSRGRYNIDTSAIEPLIAGYPKISYRKNYGFYRIVCIRICDGQRVTTSFRNLENLQAFLNSEDARSWLLDDIDTKTRVGKLKSCPLSYDKELLAIKPEICFLKPDRLRVLCIPKSGRPRTKFFRCSSEGQNDQAAMQKVEEFLTSPNFFSWITQEKCENPGKGTDSQWVHKDTVRTGTPMRLYLDDLLDFDCTKTIDVNPAVSPYLNINHNPEVPSISRTHNPNWGRAHRSDDTFSLKENTPPNLFSRTYRIISVNVRCSSRSSACRTTCGELLMYSNIIDERFSCCNEPVPAHNKCSHCNATTSSYDKWYKHDNSLLCRVCYNYLRKRNTPRPLKPKKITPKPFYTHNQCHYKLRLELMPDLEHWQVYSHKYNDEEHDLAHPLGVKRFTLTERDFIDKVRLSTGKPTAKQIGNSYKAIKQNCSPHELKQYQSRCKVIDSHALEGASDIIEEETITINPDWQSGEFDSLLGEVDCIEFEINDTDPEIAVNTTVPTVIESKTNIKAEDSTIISASSIICYKCIMDPSKKDDPFTCKESKDLDSHIKMCHRENVICCSMCFQQGNIETFSSLRLLNHHIRQCHNKDKSSKGTHLLQN